MRYAQPVSTESPTEKILKLAHSFPCLSKKLAIWKPNEFDADKFELMMSGWSHGEVLCGLFILNVWNPGYAESRGWEFNIFDFVEIADAQNREAFLLWLIDPIWP